MKFSARRQGKAEQAGRAEHAGKAEQFWQAGRQAGRQGRAFKQALRAEQAVSQVRT
jgi:hypothetical protein